MADSRLAVALALAIVALSAAGCAEPVARTDAAPARAAAAELTSPLRLVPHDALEVREEHVRRANAKIGYTVDVAYPRIADPSTPQQQAYNTRVDRDVRTWVANFEKHCAKEGSRRGPKRLPLDFTYEGTYELLFADPTFLSARLKQHSFTGYLNEDYYTLPLNFDLTTGREIELRRLFRSESAALAVLSRYCIAELLDQQRASGLPSLMVEEGAEPEAEKYASWALTPDGLAVTFAEYQVGPGCIGEPEVVVPFDVVADVVDAKGPLSRLLARRAG